MDTVQAVLALVDAAPISAILRRPKHAHVYVAIIYSWQAHLPEKVQTVCRVCDADRLEVARGE